MTDRDSGCQRDPRLPEGLLERVMEAFGPEAEPWLADHIATAERDWSLRSDRPFSSGCTCSWVAPVVRSDGSAAVLKINFPERENAHEGAALRFIEGRGAVHLLCSSDDGLTLLIERCVPGLDIRSLDVDAGNEAGAAVLNRLWREPLRAAPFETLSDVVREWRQAIPREASTAGYGPELAAAAVEMAHDLVATEPRRVLLHGDFHPGNVLSSRREPWLAIDPKPLIGDPAYDLAQWFGNRCWAEGEPPERVKEIRRQIDRMSRHLNLDPVRVARWAFVKSLGWHWGPEVARLLLDVIES